MSKAFYYAYIGTNSVRGSKGIYCLKIYSDTLQPEIVSTYDLYNSGGLDLNSDETVLLAACEGMTFHGLADGGVTRLGLDGDTMNEVSWAPGYGQRTCCVSISCDSRNAAACSFMNGNLAIYSFRPDGTFYLEHNIPTPKAANMPDALHCVKILDQSTVAVISITECAVILYSMETGKRMGIFRFAENEHPRYIEAYGDTIYALMQEPGYIYVLGKQADETGKLPMLQKISILPSDFAGRCETTTLRIAPGGDLLIAASRGNNSLSVFRVNVDGQLSLKSVLRLKGIKPRDFNISRDGQIAVVACQQSDEVYVYRIDHESYALVDTAPGRVEIPSPAAVMVGKQKGVY